MEKKKEHHEVKKEYLKTGFFEMIPIELDPNEGREGHSNSRGEEERHSYRYDRVSE
jgi:hypothetical protein